ncbi:X-ray repair cross-complementing protein 6 [Saguinus oedipus]|uniref:X-ray repair cross-complementing protein 6 n=1 Tax=Saguinus oedipus TaxID=9490 RepID=A0ABQ9TZ09_SAGOE|nr:X-ray repair cross-complementing protein 6 [Saguinus oedipus]
MLVGFEPVVTLNKHHYLRPSLFVYPEEPLLIGSSTPFSALRIKCLEKEVAALSRYTPRRNVPPCFVALVPQDEELDDQKIQGAPPGFQLSDSFDSRVLQQHFRNLEALALDLMEPEQAADLTLPGLGSLVDEFKELVYPPDYNPEGKVIKRKHDNEGSGSKRPEVEYSEEELKTHISKDALGKFTARTERGLPGKRAEEWAEEAGAAGSPHQALPGLTRGRTPSRPSTVWPGCLALFSAS